MAKMQKNPKILWMGLLIFASSLSCNKMNFSSEVKNSDSDPGIVTPTSGAISCDVYLNNHLQSLSITLPGTNPTVKADCTPKDVTYAWTVTKNGSPVSVNGLQGASSTAELTTLGTGTYKLVLKASAQNFSDYTNANSPLTVTITDSGSGSQSVKCDPKINGSLTSYTLGSDPQISANCQPADASCAWTVTTANSPVMITGLSACNSTPSFTNQNPGTYLIYLTATKPSYSAYTSTQPLTVIVPPRSNRNVVTTKTVTPQDNQLDVQLIIDNSNSMLADNQKLASRMQGFVNDLTGAGFDWQMCVTVTSAQQLSSSDPTLYWGASNYWVGNTGGTPYILKPGQANTYQIFQDTINKIGAGWAGTDDERGIKAAYRHLWNGDIRYSDASGCYRKDSGLATIVISDEDERSVGGDASQEYYAGEFKALESEDQPQTYIDLVKEVFGSTKRFTVNSIIVRPGDNACMSLQDSLGSKAHYGYKYNELTALTGGSTGSICEADYSNNLKYFKDQIVKDMASLPLECSPIGNTAKVSFSPAFSTVTRVENGTLYFNPKVPVGHTITAEYQCPQ